MQPREVGRGDPHLAVSELGRVGEVGGVDQFLDIEELLRALVAELLGGGCRGGAVEFPCPLLPALAAPVPLHRANAHPELVRDQLVAALLGRQAGVEEEGLLPIDQRGGRGRIRASAQASVCSW